MYTNEALPLKVAKDHPHLDEGGSFLKTLQEAAAVAEMVAGTSLPPVSALKTIEQALAGAEDEKGDGNGDENGDGNGDKEGGEEGEGCAVAGVGGEGGEAQAVAATAGKAGGTARDKAGGEKAGDNIAGGNKAGDKVGESGGATEQLNPLHDRPIANGTPSGPRSSGAGSVGAGSVGAGSVEAGSVGGALLQGAGVGSAFTQGEGEASESPFLQGEVAVARTSAMSQDSNGMGNEAVDMEVRVQGGDNKINNTCYQQQEMARRPCNMFNKS